MAIKTVFACQGCGAAYPKWQGQCHACEEWNTLVEEKPAVATDSRRAVGYAGHEPQKRLALSAVSVETVTRISSGLSEFDHAIGGGLVPGSVLLIGGDPGIGKSTLLLQMMLTLSASFRVLYVTGEESLSQVAMRAHRLGAKTDFQLLSETEIERIVQEAQCYAPQVMVIDSIQTMYTQEISSAPGSVSQVRESAARLVRLAKQTNTLLFLVGHVTKEGAIAGPRVLEHMVDAVLYFEGQSDSRYRVIRAVKNRFGAVNELGLFAMTDMGLRPVVNPSAIFLSSTGVAPGSVVTVAWEG